MKMKGQPNRDLNPVPPSQWRNHATNWAKEAGWPLIMLNNKQNQTTPPQSSFKSPLATSCHHKKHQRDLESANRSLLTERPCCRPVGWCHWQTKNCYHTSCDFLLLPDCLSFSITDHLIMSIKYTLQGSRPSHSETNGNAPSHLPTFYYYSDKPILGI